MLWPFLLGFVSHQREVPKGAVVLRGVHVETYIAVAAYLPICARWRVHRRRLIRSRHMAQRRQHLRRLWLIQSRDGSETKRPLTIEARLRSDKRITSCEVLIVLVVIV